jgi:opacity protein-like surface antigen
MKKTLLSFLIAFLILGLSLNSLSAQEEEFDYSKEEAAAAESENDVPIKSIMLDLGHTLDGSGICFGFGVKYWNFGASIGIAGLSPDRPNYDRRTIDITEAQETKNFQSLMINFDAHYYMNFEIFDPLTVFVSVGYYSQSDSTIGRKQGEDTWSLIAGPQGFNSVSGLSFGAGVQYPMTDNIALGIALHTRKGIYAQFEYYWF